MENPKKKVVRIISDLHMGESFGGVNKYPEPLTKGLLMFLKKCMEDEIFMLILLGDILDSHWVTPFSQTPQSYSEVIDKDENIKSIVSMIRKVGEGGKTQLVYVRGNHDDRIRSCEIKEIFGERTICCEAMKMGSIWLEHGHRFDIFCQPVHHGLYIEDFPISYFVSRYISSFDDLSQTILMGHLSKNYPDMSKVFFDGSKSLDFFRNGLFSKCQPTDEVKYLTSSKEEKEKTVTVGEVIQKYIPYIPNRASRIPLRIIKDTIEQQFMTLGGDISKNFTNEMNHPPRTCELVICGHTHTLDQCMSMEYNHHKKLKPTEEEQEGEEEVEKVPESFTYLNSGSWPLNQCFVELDLGQRNQARVMRWKFDGEHEVLKETRLEFMDDGDEENEYFKFVMRKLVRGERSTSTTDIDVSKIEDPLNACALETTPMTK